MARLIDELQLVMIPVVAGKGRTLFPTVGRLLRWELKSSRAFRNGNVFLCYTPKG